MIKSARVGITFSLLIQIVKNRLQWMAGGGQRPVRCVCRSLAWPELILGQVLYDYKGTVSCAPNVAKFCDFSRDSLRPHLIHIWCSTRNVNIPKRGVQYTYKQVFRKDMNSMPFYSSYQYTPFPLIDTVNVFIYYFIYETGVLRRRITHDFFNGWKSIPHWTCMPLSFAYIATV